MVKNIEKILNYILPPIHFKNEKNENCYKKILSTPGKISDVIRLKKSLD